NRKSEYAVAGEIAIALEKFAFVAKGRTHEIGRRDPINDAPAMAERDGVMNDLQFLYHAPGDRRSICDLEGHHAGEILHLPLRQIMLGMRGKAGIKDTLYAFVSFEIFRDCKSCLLMRLHADGQSCRATQDEPGIERRENADEMTGALDI